MGRLTIEQRDKVVEAYYENGRSNRKAFRALREYFGQHKRPTESAIGKIVRKFEKTKSVAEVKPPFRARSRRSAENIAAVLENVAENPDTSIRHRAKELNLSTTTLHRILTKDLPLDMSAPKKPKLSSEKEECSKIPDTGIDAEIEKNKQVALIKLQHKKTSLVPTDIGITWYAALEKEFKKDYFLKLSSFIDAERKTKKIFPEFSHVWSFTKQCEFNEVKVVILGQEPYHEPQQAHGLSFSVQKGIAIPPSLKNIYKELSDGIKDFKAPSHGHLCGWATQGVLLLNAVLTVRSDEPNSHKDQGWEKVTDAIIKHINENMSNVVFMLWGEDAQKKGAFINKKNHCVLTTTHPSPLSASKGFFGCKHFSTTNEYLNQNGKGHIDWNYLPDPK